MVLQHVGCETSVSKSCKKNILLVMAYLISRDLYFHVRIVSKSAHCDLQYFIALGICVLGAKYCSAQS